MVMTTTTQELRSKTDEELAEYMASWKEHSGNYILCEMEFKRRQSRGNEIRGWVSLGLSVLAIVVSVTALAAK